MESGRMGDGDLGGERKNAGPGLMTMTSNMGTIFSNTVEAVAPVKLKNVREKHTAPWYNSNTHSLKKETRNLECKWRKTNLEVLYNCVEKQYVQL